MGIAAEKYVSITTYRRNGEAVSSPVWIAPLADGTAGFTTDLDSGKVKRIRNNPKVTLRPCSMRGNVSPDAESLAATASIITGADITAIRQAIIEKYGLLARLVGVGDTIAGLFRRSKPSSAAAVSLRFD